MGPMRPMIKLKIWKENIIKLMLAEKFWEDWLPK